MKHVTVDVDGLLEKKVIDELLYEQLIAHSTSSIAMVSIQLIVGIGICGLVAALVALDPTFRILPFVGVLLVIAGVTAVHTLPQECQLLAQTVAVIGTLVFSGWIVYSFSTTAGMSMETAWIIVAASCFGVGAITRNLLLVGLAVLATMPILNMATGYVHATYVLVVREPLLTTIVYLIATAAAGVVVWHTRDWVERAATTVFGTALFLANLAVWVGSLWGDPQLVKMVGAYAPQAFAGFWAVLAIAAGVWAYAANKRWVVVLSGVFLIINVYTQWHEWLLETPAGAALAFGAVIAFGVAAYWYINRGRSTRQLAVA